jgi:N-acetylglucosamine-6-phosphate deacetylase
MLRIVCHVKGMASCILVTDAMQAATMPPGTYRLAHTEAELLPDGRWFAAIEAQWLVLP